MLGVSRPMKVGRNAVWSDPLAFLVAVRAPLPVDLGHRHVLADQARDHAGPAPVRVHVVDVLGHDRVVPVRRGEAVVVLPPLAVLVVTARILVLEPTSKSASVMASIRQ